MSKQTKKTIKVINSADVYLEVGKLQAEMEVIKAINRRDVRRFFALAAVVIVLEILNLTVHYLF